jgi:hypothetical protein
VERLGGQGYGVVGSPGNPASIEAGDFAAGFLAAAFFTADLFAAGFFRAGLFAAAFFAATFLAAGFFRAGFFAAIISLSSRSYESLYRRRNRLRDPNSTPHRI